MTDIIIFSLINLFATILGGAAGGGGGLVVAPTLVLFGLSPVQAIATAKFSGFGISAGASSRFYQEKITDKKTVITFSAIAGIGALAGSLLLVNFSEYEATIQKLMGLVIVFIGIPLLYLRNMGLKPKKRSKAVKSIGLVLLMLLVLMQAAIGSGIGALQMIIFMGMFGMTALVASATRRAMMVTVATIVLVVYINAGFVDYKFGLAALITSLIGGWIGANIAIKKGNKFIINLFAIVSLILALQLIFS